LHKKTVEFQLPYVEDTPIRIETANGGIEVRRTGGSDVAIVAELKCMTPERLEQTTVTPVFSETGELALDIIWPGGKRKSREGCSVSIETPGALGVNLRSSNGAIQIADLAGRATLRTSNGSITVQNQGGPLEARTSNGRIQASGVQGSVDLESSNGAIEATGVDGAIEAETSNGSLKLALAPSSVGPIHARSSNGSVEVKVGGAFKGTLEAKTSNGRLQFEEGLSGRMIEQDKKRAVMQFGEGGAASQLRTSNGSIKVVPLGRE
jgi:DUF4097 and DUF4098 domain-containing protein YvlB